MSVARKLWIIVALAAIGVLAMGWARIASIEPREMESREVQLRLLVESSAATIAGFHERERSGELTRDEAQKGALAAVHDMKYGKDGYFWINDMKPKMVMHPAKPELVGQDLSKTADPNGKLLFMEMVDVAAKRGAGFVAYDWPRPGDEAPVPKLSYVSGFKPWGWIVGTGIYVDDVQTAVRAGTVTVLWQSALVLAIIASLAYLVSRSIARPVANLSGGMRKLASGEVEGDLEAGLVETQAAFDDLSEYLRDAARVAERIADGDLTADVQPRSERDVLGGALARMVENLRSLVGNVSETSTTLGSASQRMADNSDEAGKAVGEIASAVSQVAEGAERQVRMVESARMATGEVSAAVDESAANARETARAAGEARTIAQQGVDAAAGATEAMRSVRDSSQSVSEVIRGLAAKSEQIGGIVATIAGIAEQTNLLALNAAIEAARAGEQGRGFAVVAEEVRKLAEESQTAASSIGALIEEIQGETRDAVRAVEDGERRTQDGVATVEQTREAFMHIGASVEDMTDRISQIAAAVEHIAASAARMQDEIGEVASVAEESSAAAEQVSASTQETSATTQEIAANAQDLARTAEDLQRLVGRFSLA